MPYICLSLFPGQETKARRLKRGAVPSQNLPVASHDKTITPAQRAQLEARSQRHARRTSTSGTEEEPAGSTATPDEDADLAGCMESWNEDLHNMFLPSSSIQVPGL